MAVTIKDVAEAAGVSISTVSYTLNNTGPVSEEKKQRILEAVKALGYVPNGMAKSLKSRKNGFIGYFAHSLYGVVYGEVLRGIENEMDRNGQEMIAAKCGPMQDITHISRLLMERMVDGAIIFSEMIANEQVNLLANARCPVVVLDRELEGPFVSSVLINNEDSAFRVGEYIHSLDLKRVACLTGRGFDGERRLLGFKQAAEVFQLDCPPNWCIDAGWDEKEAYQKTIEFIRGGQRPEVIFAFNDEMAIGCIRALQDMLLKVPEDISVIGMDDIDRSALTNPSLTTVHRPLCELGEIAAGALLGMMRGEESRKIILPTSLIQRESCIKNWAK
ncbi:HTH-type transcriptional repressor PurR [Lachnospiraceae bacterium]|jgi:LacI family transcriptional regulator|nr:LacI family transcriptional regulator [Lachnospiraceae bacterium]MCX4273071.1 LacI family DNA-binding transcriptional regulator [Acetatifactor sp.]GFH93561.1 HTH-type transcriptional repressor PurR [Lachnospiraceae bacterium]